MRPEVTTHMDESEGHKLTMPRLEPKGREFGAERKVGAERPQPIAIARRRGDCASRPVTRGLEHKQRSTTRVAMPKLLPPMPIPGAARPLQCAAPRDLDPVHRHGVCRSCAQKNPLSLPPCAALSCQPCSLLRDSGTLVPYNPVSSPTHSRPLLER